MVVKLVPKYGYGPNCYTVQYLWEFDRIRDWMEENSVEWLHLSSGPEGYGFQVTSNADWFNLKWQ